MNRLRRLKHTYLEKIKSSPLGYRLAKGAFWSITGSAIARVLTLLAAIMVARLIGKREFGELGIIQATVGTFGALAAFGMDSTTAKYVAELRNKDGVRAGRIIQLAEIVSVALGTVLTFAFVFGASWISANLLSAPHLAGLLRIGSVLLFTAAVNSSQIGSLAGFEAFKTIMKINAISGGITFVLTLAGVYLFGLRGVVYALVVSMVMTLLLNHFYLRLVAANAGVLLDDKSYFREWRVIVRFSLPAILSWILVGPVNWVCSAMLVNRPHGYDEMGIFNAANQWRAIILFFPTSVATVVLPILSNLAGAEEKGHYNKVLIYNVFFNGGITIVLAGGISILSTMIMSSYGKDFSSGGLILTILSFSAVLAAVANVFGGAIASSGKMWIGFALNFVWAVFLIVTTYVFIERGALGIAIANLVAYSAHLLLIGLFTYAVLIRPHMKSLA